MRRLVAGSTVIALLAPWVVALGTVVHLGLHHDHEDDHEVAAGVASAMHGHAHEFGSVPHEHSAAPAQGVFTHLPDGPFVTVVVPSVALPSDPGSSLWTSAAKRGPPLPASTSPPVLRV